MKALEQFNILNIRSKPIPYIVGGIAFLIAGVAINKVLQQSYTIINPGERGMLIQLGKTQPVVLEEGLHLKTPFVTQVRRLNIQMRKTDIREGVRTRDLQRLTVDLSLNWRIEPSQLAQTYQLFGDTNQLDKQLIIPVVNESLKAATPRRTAEQILLQREELKEEIFQAISTRLNRYGIRVEEVNIINATVSEAITKAVEAKQVAEQQAKQAEYEAVKAAQEGKAELNRAKGEAEAEIVRAKGKAEAQRLMQKTITPELLQQQAIAKWDGRYPSVISGNQMLPQIIINPQALNSAQPSQ